MIIDDYLQYSKEYKSRYGNKTIVLMQVGSFYELYAITDDTNEDIYTIADICNIQVSRKNKSITEVSVNNPLMAGFPLYTLKKFTNILLSNNYTIVLVEQVSEPPNPERKITEILSPGMNMNVSTKNTNYMMLLYYEYHDNLPMVGISGVDLTTGNTFVYETGSTLQDPDFVNDETYRLIATYNPSEVIILSDKDYGSQVKTYLLKNLNLSKLLAHLKWESFEYIKILAKLSYQIEILEKAFNKHRGMLSIIDNLNLEKFNLGRLALCLLLHFAWEHNVDLIKKLNHPEIINDNIHLSIEYNSAVQLNVLGLYQHDKPLIELLNRCMTAFGSRGFKERLLKPIVNVELLCKRYDEITYLLYDNKFVQVGKHLGKILDLERIKRKMLIGKMHPQDWRGFHISIENAIDILSKYYNEDVRPYSEMVEYYIKILDISEADKYNLNEIKGNIFTKGTYTDLDKLTDDFNAAYDIIKGIHQSLNNLDIGDTKIDYTDKEGYHITMTKKRYDNAKSRHANYMKQFQLKSSSSTTVKITNQDMIVASYTMEDKQDTIAKQVTLLYQSFVNDFIDKHKLIIDKLIQSIVNIDIACCNAKNAYEYRYYRPTITTSDASFIKAESLRHPIIERIDDTVPYIGNDIYLSNEESGKNGMLLYGINSAGKSSLMKSVGLNLIMAQSGMFVASCNMQYYPYKHIFTRISGMDNIYKGMSSFIVEMTELKNILQRCDKYSLVLGDEICNGTEAISAVSIVAAAIDTLVKQRASFIFATHLHELPSLNIIKCNMSKISINHIHITVHDNKIIYERKLKEGQGSSTYGIEVCKSLQMPYDFMKNAEHIRKEIQGLNMFMINPSSSKYNKDLYMTKCALCDAAAEDTHHIHYQSDSINGMFTNFHQNIRHNLVPLCKQCHLKEHRGELDIKGYKKTSDGVIIEVDSNPASDSHHIQEQDMNDNDYKQIMQYVKRGRCNWFIRRTKTSVYKTCTDENKIIERINKLVNKHITSLDNIYNIVYDPNM